MAHVLIVEDDPDVREMMETYLRFIGYSTACASNGREGLARLAERTPCVVVLDLMMPVMSGWQFREAQLANPATAQIPVVCVSAVFDRATVTERLGIPCLGKPLDFDDLSRLVGQACSR
jgi:CheY-like chemotaxis protein